MDSDDLTTAEKRRIINNWCYDCDATQGARGDWTCTITLSKDSVYYQETPTCGYDRMIDYTYKIVRYNVISIVSDIEE